MVWGGIGHRGFRTLLIKFDKHVNSLTYIQAIQAYNIPGIISNVFGANWCWQQDNAPALNALNTRIYLNQVMPNMIQCPA